MIVETGSGIRGSSSYVTVDFVTNYLASRGRQTENNWASSSTLIKESACINATDYLEKKYSSRFKGSRKYILSSYPAEAQIVFLNNASNGNTLTLADEVYTFVSSLGTGRNQIQIGSTISNTLDNLISCLYADPAYRGSRYSSSEESRHATIEKIGSTAIKLTSLSEGTGGNSTVLSTTVGNTTVTQFVGGVDGGPQSLSFPRKDAFYDSGEIIQGIPEDIKKAVSEYAVRSLVSPLLTDPSIESSGQITRKLEKIGPIETEIAYTSGSYGSFTFSPYPAGDELVKPFLKSNSHRVIRG